MSKILTVAVREFIETVKTKAFFIGALVVPGVLLAFIFASENIREVVMQEEIPARVIGLVDRTGQLVGRVQAQIDQYNEQFPKRPFELRTYDDETSVNDLVADIRAGELYAFFLVPPDVLAGETPIQTAQKDTDLEAGQRLKRMINQAIVVARFDAADPPIDLARVQRLQANVPITTIDLETGEKDQSDPLAKMLTPFAAMFLLFMGTMQISYGLLTSVIEEKSSRVIEVLLSAVSPTQLMAGKILGMVGVGLVLIGVWGTVGLYAAHAQGLQAVVNTPRLVLLVVYFLPGFLLFSGVLAGIGAACNSLKEAQSMASPISIITIVPLALWFPIMQSPNSAFAVALSFIPPVTPFVMVLRIWADPQLPFWQIVATQAVLWFSVLAAIWAAGKIFRVGILMYGKPPSLKELVHWMKFS